MTSARSASAISWSLAGALLAIASAARADDRPVLAGEATIDTAHVRVHYATTGIDLATPAFAQQVADVEEAALAALTGLGFRAPIPDADHRIDVYLMDLQQADGHAGLDFLVGENDFAGYGYPSITEGITSVYPHELFHLIQNAYSTEQSSTWTEGSAVWAVEQLYGDANADFERFLPSFLGKTFRPFERTVTGFGDGYVYGAALWPVYLGPDRVRAAWEMCGDGAAFADTIDDAEFTAFTRWNAFAGTDRGPYGARAKAWPAAPRTNPGDPIYLEGLSARYVPISIAARSQVSLDAAAGWIVPTTGAYEDGVELPAIVEPGEYTLVATGLARGSIATAAALHVDDAPPPDDESPSGGCSAVNKASSAWLILILLFCRRGPKSILRLQQK